MIDRFFSSGLVLQLQFVWTVHGAENNRICHLTINGHRSNFFLCYDHHASYFGKQFLVDQYPFFVLHLHWKVAVYWLIFLYAV